MNLISTSWTCQQCGATCICDPPWHRLCDPCLANLQTLTLQSLSHTGTCPSCGGPVCPDCGDAMPLLVPIRAPAEDPGTGQATGLLIPYRTRHEGVTGDEC